MIPFQDNVHTERPPVVVWTLIGLNTVVYLLEVVVFDHSLEDLFMRWGVVPRAFTDSGWGAIHIESSWLAWITHQFLHGGFLHVAGNMLFLWVFGRAVEDRMGSLRFSVFYLMCGVAAALAQFAFHRDSTLPLVGASGAIYGVMGAYYLMFPSAQVRALVWLLPPIRLWLPAFIFLVIRVAGDFWVGSWELAQTIHFGGVAVWAHLGGFLFGLFAHWPMLAGRDWHSDDPYWA